VPEQRVRTRVLEIAEILDLTPDLKKRAAGLNADIKQIISLGRGLVREDVSAILFDEPLTVIDPHVKWLIRRQLKQIHEQLDLTMIYVTHDQLEALTFADKVNVMLDGAIIQQGTPEDLFEAPTHTYVGFFIGSPGMNLLPGTVDQGHAVVESEKITLPDEISRIGAKARGTLKLGIRPEFTEIVGDKGKGGISVQVKKVETLGNFHIVTAQLGRITIKAKMPEQTRVDPDADNYAVFSLDHMILYENEKALTLT
jgi:glycerol transport system ATP-binding protein